MGFALFIKLKVGLDSGRNTSADTLVDSGAVSAIQRAQYGPGGPRSSALHMPALLAEVGGYLPRLPWDWFQFPNAKPACQPEVTQACRQGCVQVGGIS